MSRLFGKSEQRRAQETAAQAECERLSRLPAADLAAEILPAFRAGQKHPANGPLGASEWLMAEYPRGVAARCVQQLRQPVAAAIQALEHAGLLHQVLGGEGRRTRFAITSVGETALAENSARSYL